MIWKLKPTLEMLNGFGEAHMGTHLGIQITEIGDHFLKGTMPVDERTRQPFGILHGGASCVLAETLGSIAGSFCCDPATEMVVGLEINANHIKSARNGIVTGTASPIHIGKSTQVWEIKIENEGGGLVCISRLTVAVRKR